MQGLTGLDALAGRWSLSRRILHADGAEHRFAGTATFAPDADGLVQDEEGDLTLPDGQVLHGTRRYLWREAGGRLAIFFADGRPFHEVPLGLRQTEATHPCAPDTYRVIYDFAAFPRWSSVWSVTGPRKDYVMTSHYAPMPA